MEVDNPGQIVNATRFAQLTGVSRERLRMWERRHGFPVPVRVAGGPRRYAIGDVPRVVAVRRAAESGVPIPAAIARTVYPDAPHVSPAAYRAVLEHAPLPGLLVSGPEPLRIEYVNAALQATPASPRVGRELGAEVAAFAASPSEQALRDLFTRSVGAAELEHPAWTGRPGETTRSVAYRLPVEPDQRPLVAMTGLEAARERAARERADALEHEAALLRRRDERHARWLEGAAAVTLAFQIDPGPTVLDQGADVLVRQLNALDAAVAASVAGQVVVPGSRRGLLAPTMVTVAAHPELARHLREAAPMWLESATAAAFGVPPGLHACASPILVGGENLGLLLIVFDEPEEIGGEERKLLTILSAALGFALLRDRLARELREAARG